MKKYTKDLLDDFCLANKITLLSVPTKLGSEAIIEGKCMNAECMNNFKKMYKNLLKPTMGHCSQCVKSCRRGKTLTLYNWKLLKNHCDKKKIQLKKDYSNEKLGSKSRIEGICETNNCIGIFNIGFDKLINTDAICDACFYNKRTLTIKNVINDKYGCDNISQVSSIKQLKKDTCMKNYGVEFATQSLVVQEKIKQTNVEKYGFEFATQSNEVKDKTKITCLEKYGVEFYFQSDDKKDKSKETNMEKYGFEYASQSNDVKDKMKETCLQNLGVEYPMQSDEVQNKCKQQIMEKYGVVHISQVPEFRQKAEDTHLARYGVKSPLQTHDSRIKNRLVQIENHIEIQEKKKRTCLEKYGVEYASQNAEIMEKISKHAYNLKDYKLPSGKIIKIQGYEHYALDELLEQDITEDDIITGTSNVPEIWYTDNLEQCHRYYVDIFIPSQNKMIEVKSTWTAEKNWEIIFIKQNACKKAGYNCEIWIYNKMGEKIECYK